MCGIAGLFSNTADLQNYVEAMNASQKHRGPDGEGVWNDDGVALGHVRLAVLDLSEAGHQPFASRDGRYVMTYNGEVYNYIELRDDLRGLGYTFCTGTDTEVVLAAYIQWGRDCLVKFNGMWAFAIWDKQEKELFCARDHFGIKPFYYTQQKKAFAFASEIKALLTLPDVPRKPNDSVIYDYLLLGLVDHGEETFFEGIYQLPAAHVLIYKKGKKAIYRWWDLEDKKQKCDNAQIRRLLEESVKLRQRSDVPVGSCLSGGLDSTAIVSLMARQNPDKSFKTFTAVYGDPTFDEDDYVRETANMYSELSPQYIDLSSRDLWNKLRQLVRIQDEPFQSSSIFAQLAVMEYAQNEGYKVLMDGQGADECLAGYDIYLSSWAYNGGVSRFWKRASEIKKLRGFKASSLLIQSWHSRLYRSKWIDRIYSLSGQISSDMLSKKFKRQHEYKSFWKPFSKDFLKDHLYQMLNSSNLPCLLRYEDRNSMACSIETRLPYLDPNFVQECFSLDSSSYIRNGVTKVPLREVVKDIIPSSIEKRRDKIGFATPEQKWFKQLQDQINEVLCSGSFKNRGYFNTRLVQKYFKDYCQGKPMRKFPLWRVLNLELWFREFIDDKS